MVVTIHPSQLSGTIHAAASKSSMQRACAAALLTPGETVLVNPGKSNDDLAAIDVIQKLGASVEEDADGNLVIRSAGIDPKNNEVNCGESGLGIRMFTPIAALSKKQITLTGKGSLLTRPMDFFDEILPKLGVKVQSQNGRLPLQIQGPLQPADIEVDGSLSSQFLTGLLMAYGAAGADGVAITVKDLKSKPYIDLTLQVMKHFGWDVVNHNHERFSFNGNKAQKAAVQKYTVEGDWSGAAFLLVAGAIAGPITVKGLDVFSTQADKAVLQALMDCGCVLSIEPGQIDIGPMPSLKAFHFNANDCPDLFPPLVALAAYCDGTTVIEGVNRLTHKESNRALTLQEEFAKLGIEITLQDDLMLVKGGTLLKGATTHSHHDHRIAMACAVAGLRAGGNVTIEEADAINKSYPDFYEHLKKLGAKVSVITNY
ncbi:3-phosphoshikimate 1-carboxyvinyltransferase [Sediminibacterium roseum]|uniref:3-phosphoshikimate 1-carboxyvinyltransferase n=1 Tax=Sediminibacterium roseum TaxID=1978412 RepID=A0ABW9ZU93_9BACT|nr:3-phosphoshikimate 1-carboxyvinyltransferase [Sediminibacterium roseum]NCI50718.1 3-phosphoshikimate 1-carboxyvinyltransferase [Sediminibacterium roseum]